MPILLAAEVELFPKCSEFQRWRLLLTLSDAPWMAGGGSRWAWESAASGSFFKGKGRCARFLSCHRMTWLYLDYLCKDPVSKYGCVLKCWGLGLQSVNLLGNTVQSVTQAKLVNHPLWAPGGQTRFSGRSAPFSAAAPCPRETSAPSLHLPQPRLLRFPMSGIHPTSQSCGVKVSGRHVIHQSLVNHNCLGSSFCPHAETLHR